jgi:hypothetical protein
METLEYRTADKSTWGRGEWQDEPDKVQWKDEATGLPCLIVRNWSGALCGYVGVTEGHPFYEKDYGATLPHECDESCNAEHDYHRYEASPGGALGAHGGITFAGGCHKHDQESYARFLAQREKDKDEAKQYPRGDAARRLKDWGNVQTFEEYQARCEASYICHLPAPGESDRVWWFGFDCHHSGDYAPGSDSEYGRYRYGSETEYRDIPYVKEQCASLAQQLARIGSRG